MSTKLREAAKTINRLAKQEEDARRQLCIAIAAAMELVKKESNLSWSEWADQNLRRPDGSKWSKWTLYSYASFGRDPKKLEHLRETVARHGRNARQALRNISRTPVESHATGAAIDHQLEALMFAWRAASSEARKLFLERVANEIDRSVA